MHVHSSPPNTDNWQAATQSRTSPVAAQASGSAPGPASIDDLADELSGAGTPSTSPMSSGGTDASPSSLGSGFRSLLTSLQAGGSAPADASPMSQLGAMLARYQGNGFAQAGTDTAGATDLSV